MFRSYQTTDFEHISDFLDTHYLPDNRDGNWLQPIWEYMHSHPMLDESHLHKIGLWENAGKIAGVVHYESELGEAFFQYHPDFCNLKPSMLNYAEQALYNINPDGRKKLLIYVNDFDKDMQRLARQFGYKPNPDRDRPLAIYRIKQPLAEPVLQDGFHLISQAEDNELKKMSRALWRGFNHPGEPPAEDIADRVKMQSVPNYRKDLKIAVVAANGNWVTFCGMWYDERNQFALIEPLATDPDYRRMGLAHAAVLEGIRRCAALGAQVCYVGSSQPFYLSLGFKVIYTSQCWEKEF